MEFPQININTQKQKPKLYVAKPNKEIIGNIHEHMNCRLGLKAYGIHELEFEIPYFLDKYCELISNENINKTKQHYYIKLELGSFAEWFIIKKSTATYSDDGHEVKHIRCLSLAHELTYRIVQSYSVVSYTIEEIMNGTDEMPGVLKSLTGWKVGYISDLLYDVRRSVDVTSGKNVLDFLTGDICDIYNCLLLFNTDKREISFYSISEVGKNRGFRISRKKYLQMMELEDSDESFCTYLTARGHKGLGISGVTTTGQNAIEDYSYYLYPYEEDDNKNIIRHSDYMTDSLAYALTRYKEKIDEYEGEFQDLLEEKRNLQTMWDELEAEWVSEFIRLEVLWEKETTQQSSGTMMVFEYVSKRGGIVSTSTDTNPDYKYFWMCKTSNADNFIVTMNGINYTIPPDKVDTWVFIGKTADREQTHFSFSGLPIDETVMAILMKTTLEEYEEEDNGDELIKNYNTYAQQDIVDDLEEQMDNIQIQIDGVNSEIEGLRSAISTVNNFSQEQLNELIQFTVQQNYTNDAITNEYDLLKEAQEYMKQVNTPAILMNIDIVNFLSLLDDQSDWDKFNFGESTFETGLLDTILVYHDRMGIDVEAHIVEIHYDFEQENIELVVSNVRERLSEAQLLLKELNRSSSAASTMLMEKYKWDKAEDTNNIVEQILNEKWKASQREINAAYDESVDIGGRGITVVSKEDPNKILRIVSGVIGLSVDGGKNYQTAIDGTGVYAETIMGHLIAGKNLVISNESGTFTVDRDGVRVSGSSFQVDGGIPSIIDGLDYWNTIKSPTDPIRQMAEFKRDSYDFNIETYENVGVDAPIFLSFRDDRKGLLMRQGKDDIADSTVTLYLSHSLPDNFNISLSCKMLQDSVDKNPNDMDFGEHGTDFITGDLVNVKADEDGLHLKLGGDF